jgi:hypothetical protein
MCQVKTLDMCLGLYGKNGSGRGTRTPDTRIMIPLL